MPRITRVSPLKRVMRRSSSGPTSTRADVAEAHRKPSGVLDDDAFELLGVRARCATAP
jgi:hypothetical protein